MKGTGSRTAAIMIALLTPNAVKAVTPSVETAVNGTNGQVTATIDSATIPEDLLKILFDLINKDLQSIVDDEYGREDYRHLHLALPDNMEYPPTASVTDMLDSTVRVYGTFAGHHHVLIVQDGRKKQMEGRFHSVAEKLGAEGLFEIGWLYFNRGNITDAMIWNKGGIAEYSK